MRRLFYLYLIINVVYSQCLNGTYKTENGCLDCPSGYFSSIDDASQCNQCGNGQFQPYPNKSSCEICPTGWTNARLTGTNSPGSINCSICSGVISYIKECVSTCPSQSWDVDNYCITCPVGQYRSGSACVTCPIGQYRSTLSPIGCKNCTIGTIVNTERTTCTQCEVGKIEVAHNTCDNCPAGQSSPIGSSKCFTCPSGKHGIGCIDCAAGKYGTPCTDCPTGQYSSAGSVYCESCPSGEPNANASNCIDCPAGTVIQDYFCADCAAGFYQQEKMCVNCPSGWISSGGQTNCTICGSGKFENNSISCDECPTGLKTNLMHEGSYRCCSACSECSAGYYRAVEGEVCLTCPSGKYSNNEAVSCTNCNAVIGEYAVGTKNRHCLTCPEGYATDGTSVCTNCAAGRYENGYVCQNCPRGWYSDNDVNAVCERCNVGVYTTGTSSTTANECSEECGLLQFWDTGNSKCVNCERGKKLEGYSCINCPLGYYKDQTSTSCKTCPKGWTTEQTGQITCFVCPVGSTCACPAGQYSDQTICKDCPTGFYGHGSSVCEPCPIKTYQNQIGQSYCRHCIVGTFGSTSGMENCENCPLGFFQQSIGSGACEECPIGQYSSVTGANVCTPCSRGKSTGTVQSTLSSECTECAIGKMELDHICTNCREGQYQNNTGSYVCLGCPTAKWSAPGSQNVGDCFKTTGLITYIFGDIQDSKKEASYELQCEIRPNFVMLCPGCKCDADSRNGFWAGPICGDCQRGFATRYCTSICPGYDGLHDSTICNGNGRCWFGRMGNGLCYCGGKSNIDNSAENAYVDVQLCPAGRICPGYGVTKKDVTTYIPNYYIIQYRQYSSFVLQMTKYTPERGHMWFTRFSPAKAFENLCSLCISKYSDTHKTEVGYWAQHDEYEIFPTVAQSPNGFHGENCQYECAVCLNSGFCVHSPHPFRYTYTIKDTFYPQRQIVLPTTACVCSSNVYDASHMCCPNGFQPYVFYGKKLTTPYSRYSTVPYISSIDNKLLHTYYRDKDLWLEDDISLRAKYYEPQDYDVFEGTTLEGNIAIATERDISYKSYKEHGPYNKHIFHGTTKEICRACPGLFGKGTRVASVTLVQTEQDAENYWWDFPASAGAKKCNGIGVCDFYNHKDEIAVDFMGNVDDYILLKRGSICRVPWSGDGSGMFVNRDTYTNDEIKTIQDCVAYATKIGSKFVGWADESYIGGHISDMRVSGGDKGDGKFWNEALVKENVKSQNYAGYAKDSEGWKTILKENLPRPDTDSDYTIFPNIVKKCIAFKTCDESTELYAFNIYSIEIGRGDERLQLKKIAPLLSENLASFNRFDTCFTYTKDYKTSDSSRTNTRQKLGLYLTIDYKQGEDPFLGGLCPPGYFCSQNSKGTGFKEACPIGFYQPYDGRTRGHKDIHCSRLKTVSNGTDEDKYCQKNPATLVSDDYVDKVCKRCPRNTYSIEGFPGIKVPTGEPSNMYSCSNCPHGRVKKISGSFDPRAIDVYNIPTMQSPWWFYMPNEMGTELSDCASVPPSVIHIPSADYKMEETTKLLQFLPVLSCPYGYSSSPGGFIIEDRWDLYDTLLIDEPVTIPPFIYIEGIRKGIISDVPCACILSTQYVQYLTPETKYDCKKYAEDVELVHSSTNLILDDLNWFGCMKNTQGGLTYSTNTGRKFNYPTRDIKFVCEKVTRSPDITSDIVSTYCYQCPGDAVTGPTTGICSTCSANLVKSGMKIVLQKIVKANTARMYQCDNTGKPFYNDKFGVPISENLALDLAYNDNNLDGSIMTCPIKERARNDTDIELRYATEKILGWSFKQRKDRVWKAEQVFTFVLTKKDAVKDVEHNTASVELHISDCILACSTIFDTEQTILIPTTFSTIETLEANGWTTSYTEDNINKVKAKGATFSGVGSISVRLKGNGKITIVWGQETQSTSASCQLKKGISTVNTLHNRQIKNIDTISYQNGDELTFTGVSANAVCIINSVTTQDKKVRVGYARDTSERTWCMCNSDQTPSARGIATVEANIQGNDCYEVIQGGNNDIKSEPCILKSDLKVVWYESEKTDNWATSEFPLCTTCSPGKYYTGSACIDCEPGSFTATPLQAQSDVCQFCPAGYYQNSPGKSGCRECYPGVWQEAVGTSSCKDCPSGFFMNHFKEDVKCTSCPKGFWQAYPGNTFCTACQVGKFESSTAEDAVVNMDSCHNCPEGYVQPHTGKEKCEECLAGLFMSYSGGTICTSCQVGKYQESPKQILCKDCESGLYQNQVEQVSCKACSKNEGITYDPTWDDETGETAGGKTSSVGKYQPSRGQTECLVCPGGNWCSATAKNKCGTGQVLPEGHRRESDATPRCIPCEPPWYKASSSDVKCEKCPSNGYVSSPTVCTVCVIKEGKYPILAGGVPVRCGQAEKWQKIVEDKPVHCPANHQRNPAGSGCDACPVTKFFDGTKCRACPKTGWTVLSATNEGSSDNHNIEDDFEPDSGTKVTYSGAWQASWDGEKMTASAIIATPATGTAQLRIYDADDEMTITYTKISTNPTGSDSGSLSAEYDDSMKSNDLQSNSVYKMSISWNNMQSMGDGEIDVRVSGGCLMFKDKGAMVFTAGYKYQAVSLLTCS